MNENNSVKKSFVDSFRVLLESKPLSKISITDLVSESNISRQTFYRHFGDFSNFLYYVH